LQFGPGERAVKRETVREEKQTTYFIKKDKANGKKIKQVV
jgi:hypothetical protein